MSFDVVLYFFADDGYEIRVQLEGYPSFRAAARFQVGSYELQLNGDELSLVDEFGPVLISGSANSGIKAFLFRQKAVFDDIDYELVNLPFCEWRSHPALARGVWGVGGSRIISSNTQQEHTNGTSRKT